MNAKQHTFLRFAISAIIYILIVIWIGNYWLLFGLIILFDIHVSKKTHWSFWKKRNGNDNAFIEWLDALIFAVIAVSLINIFLFQNYKIPTGSMEKTLLIGDHLFVSKLAYGPRMPNTPIAFPFTQNTLPLIKGKSWSDIIHWPYKRLTGFGRLKNNDPVVFNFPEGDTVVLEDTQTSYYEIVRSTARQLKDQDLFNTKQVKDDSYYKNLARKEIRDKFSIVYRPVDRRENYVKRCIGIPGDTVLFRKGIIFINGKPFPENTTQQLNYAVGTKGTKINAKAFERLGIAKDDQHQITGGYLLPLTQENSEKIARFTNVAVVYPDYSAEGEPDPQIFPYSKKYKWNADFFGPLWIPAKGAKIRIDTSNIFLYERIIDVYENNDLRIEGEKIFINNAPAETYTFKMDYYWMIGDNRHMSADSRFWGFVPEDHIVGKPKFIWLSLDKDVRGLQKVRMNRFLLKTK